MVKAKDKQGNTILLKESGLYLILASDSSRARQLFRLTKDGFLRVVKPNNILKGQFIGYNPAGLRLILDNLKQKFVFFQVKGKYYQISIIDLLDNERYLWFKGQGFERQQFISLEELEEWNKL